MTESVKDTLETSYYYATALHYIAKPEFIQDVLPVFDEGIEASRKEIPMDPLYPSTMTANLFMDPRMKNFCQYVAGTAWNILSNQGYKMDDKITYFHSLWGQQHEKYGDMDEHVHNDNVQIVGFYFLECPENCPKLVIHDPRPGKVLLGITEADPKIITQATNATVFEPKAGSLFFSNAWLPHSFTRNGSDRPFKFIHINVSIMPVPVSEGPIIV